MSDLIYRKDAVTLPVMPKRYRKYQTNNLDDAYEKGWEDLQKCIDHLPSAQQEQLTDDDFEAIRIHLNAYKEKLCNQQRWKEAEEYQRIIDRFMAFASAQPERKKGKCIWCDSPFRIEYYWIDREGCTASFQDEERHIVATGIAKFCPNCGRRMER